MQTTLYHNFSGRNPPDFSREQFNSLIVTNGIVAAVDFGLEILAKYRELPKVDLGGCTIFPAFADAHVHFLQTGLMLAGCRLDSCASLADVFDHLRTARTTRSDEWLLAWNIDESRLVENRLPTTAELDSISSDHPMWVSRVDLHSAVPNSRARQWAERVLPEATLQNGVYRRDDYYALSGLLINELSTGFLTDCLRLAKNRALRQGVSTVHALEGGGKVAEETVQCIADFLRQPGFHGVLYHQSEHADLARRNNWGRLGGCLMVDGSFGSRTAALLEPYADDPGNRGNLYRNRTTLENLLRLVHSEGMQLAMHAIGDRALDLLTQVHAWGREKYGPPPLPHRIEHFELPTNRCLSLARQAGLFISVQPAFEHFWGGADRMYAMRLGSKRAAQTNPFKTMISTGLSLAGGSDSPVTPIDPLLGIHSLVNHPNEDERLNVNTAFQLFITEPHRFAAEEGQRGRLQPGFRADFICLDQDPFLFPTSRLQEMTLRATYVDGQEVFRKPV